VFPLKREVTKMGKVIIKNAVQRKHGHLYYVDGQGNVCEAVMSRGGGRKKKAAAKKKTATKKKTAAKKKR
jgi:hypothetical protein